MVGVPGALQDALENAMLITCSSETLLSPQICIRGSHSELCSVPLVGESGQFLPVLRIPADISRRNLRSDTTKTCQSAHVNEGASSTNPPTQSTFDP